MPHVIVKLYQGRSEEQKARLAAEIVTDIVDVLNSADESVSLAIEDVKPGEWAEKVYRTDILGNWDKLYKRPGYSGAVLSASGAYGPARACGGRAPTSRRAIATGERAPRCALCVDASASRSVAASKALLACATAWSSASGCSAATSLGS